MREYNVFTWIQVLALFGIMLAVYLLWEQFSPTTYQLCNINSVVNCNAVISGPVSKTFGLPTPLFGLVGYIVMFVAATSRWRKTLLGVATGGLAFCAWIAYQELYILHVICPVCICCQLIMLTVFTLALFVQRSHPVWK